MEISDIYVELKTNKESFPEVNRRVLKQLLEDNKDTEIGKRYGFSDIKDEKQYRDKVPISLYKDYAGYIRRMKNGETGLTTAYDLYCMLATSGSTDEGKLIPITSKALGTYGDIMDRYLQELVKDQGGKRLFISFLQTDLSQMPKMSDTMLFTASYYRFLYENDLLDIEDFAGEKVLNFFPKPCDFLYVKLWTAFAYEDLTSIESVYLYDFLVFFQYLEEHYDTILKDMESGKVSSDVRIPKEVKDKLESLDISSGRIEKIRSECSKGFDNIVERLWKSVKVVSGIGSKAFQTDEISIRKYIGNISVWHYIYAASEAVMAVPVGTDSYDYAICPGNAYYEFYCEDEDRMYDPEELKEGDCYELLLTTFSGLYRYATGDILKVMGFYGKIPVLRFVRRRNLVLNLAGEKTAMDVLDRAMRRLASEMDSLVWQYYFYEDYSRMPACYHGVIAMDDETNDNVGKRDYSKIFDGILMELSRDYYELRNLGSVATSKIEFVHKDDFMTSKEKRLGTAGQPKPQHIWRTK
ncbi:MAG: GH3 auxin-responsive promoter family protein [Lachnospiraceae bacterium]|nr:GH3 auxin-responsive promoter family protein [Lachnospiraceae bacterium]